MVNSMTGFATRRGQSAGAAWLWEARGVNGRGLDMRLRLPDWIDGLEPQVRAGIAASVARGNVPVSLTVQRDGGVAVSGVNPDALNAALTAMAQVRAAAEAQGLPLAPGTLAEVLGLRGVWDSAAPEADTTDLCAALLADLPGLIADFNAMRAGEGRALAEVIVAQIDRIAALTDAAANLAKARGDQVAANLRADLARILANADGVDESRVAQELALIAVKSDVTEEIDRLVAHIAAARAHMAAKGPVGRKLDFLMQEFNREANTLCSKAASTALTTIGLDLKVVIDQMREQVANVE